MKPIKSIVLIFIIFVISANHLYSEIYGSVSGIVTEEGSNKVVPGMIVYSRGLDNPEGITNNEGRYFIKLVKPGKYIIEFGAKFPYCTFPSGEISIEPGKNFVYNKTVKIGGTIRGKVLNRANKSPFPGIDIYTFGKFAGVYYETTKEDGSFFLGGDGGLCPSDFYYVRARHKDSNIAYKIINGVSVKKGVETNIEDIIFDLNDLTGIDGYVKSSLDGKPIKNATVFILSEEKKYAGTDEPIEMGRVKTNCDGYYYIKNLERGIYRVYVLPEYSHDITDEEYELSDLGKVIVKKGTQSKLDTELTVHSYETNNGEVDE